MNTWIGHQSRANHETGGFEMDLDPFLRVRSLPTRDLFIRVFNRHHVRALLGWGVGHCVCAITIVHHVHWFHQA